MPERFDNTVDLPQGVAFGGYVKKTLRSGLIISFGVIVLYLMQDQLRDVFSEGERLRTIRPLWFLVMLLLELASLGCLWWLSRIVLPKISWFVAITSQLVSNAVSRVIPGGAATGGAVYFRMLSVSGVRPSEAGRVLAATSILTTGALVAIPTVGLSMALLGAPVPENLLPIAVAGGIMFLALLGLGAVLVVTDKPLFVLERITMKLFAGVALVLRRPKKVFEHGLFVLERDRLIDVVGSRWPAALAASAGKWAFDYLALVAALYSVGANPRLSLVLLAYAGAQVSGMIPITPGGFGVVDVVLYTTLIVSGISAQDASLATIAYRLVSTWVPIVSGLGAWLVFTGRGYLDHRH